MDFSPLGSSTFYSTDQIASNIYANSGASYDAIMTGAKIRQRASPIYKDEIERLQKAKASKLNKKPQPNDTFTTAAYKAPTRQESFPVMMNPLMGMNDTGSDLTVLVVVGVILVIVLVAICRSVYKACREINSLAIMMLNFKVKEKDSSDQTPPPPPPQPAYATTAAPVGMAVSATSSSAQLLQQQQQQQRAQQELIANQRGQANFQARQRQFQQQQYQQQQAQQYQQRAQQAQQISFSETQPPEYQQVPQPQYPAGPVSEDFSKSTS